MRLFVAVYPPPEALEHLAAAVGRLRLGQAAAAGASVGLSARALWHLTVAFLGETEQARVPAAAAALDTAVNRWRASATAKGSATGAAAGVAAAAGAPPRLRLAGGGRFGRRRFTVLWVGLDGDLAGLRALAGEVRRGLRQAKLSYDDRKPFRPHLTFARPAERLPAADIDADLTTLASYTGPWWSVESVQLVRSRPGHRPVHDPLVIVPLAGRTATR